MRLTLPAVAAEPGELVRVRVFRDVSPVEPEPWPWDTSPEVVGWLVDNYCPPRRLTQDNGMVMKESGDPMVEAAAKVYLSRPRSETFIEWLWRKFPSEGEDR